MIFVSCCPCAAPSVHLKSSCIFMPVVKEMYVQALHVRVVFFYMFPGTCLSKTTGQLLILSLVCVLGKAKKTNNVASYHNIVGLDVREQKMK